MPKRKDGLFEQIAQRETLRRAFHRAAQGKSARPEIQTYRDELERQTQSLRNDLRAGTLQLGGYRTFTIHDPKRREITAPCFRERVLHHAIFLICEPLFDRWLMHDSYACRTGKGRLAALHRATQFAREEPWVLKMDVRHCFASIDRDILYDQLLRRFKDKQVLALFALILDSAPGERGLPVGSLSSQHFANFHLGHLDRFLKEHLRRRQVIRYMDDVLVFGPSPVDLAHVASRTAREARSALGLELKPPTILPVAKGFPFLGFLLRPSASIPLARSTRRTRAKLSSLERAYMDGDLSGLALQTRATALMAYPAEAQRI